jgi:hypothetical protein
MTLKVKKSNQKKETLSNPLRGELDQLLKFPIQEGPFKKPAEKDYKKPLNIKPQTEFLDLLRLQRQRIVIHKPI